jgi:hypothetical protein
MRIGRGNRSTQPAVPILCTTNPTWLDLGLNPGRRGGKPATNRLSYVWHDHFFPSNLFTVSQLQVHLAFPVARGLNYKSGGEESTRVPAQGAVLRYPLQTCYLFLPFLPSQFVASSLMGIDYIRRSTLPSFTTLYYPRSCCWIPVLFHGMIRLEDTPTAVQPTVVTYWMCDDPYSNRPISKNEKGTLIFIFRLWGKIKTVTWLLKAGIRGPEKSSVAKQRPVNAFSRQPKLASASTISGPSLGDSPLTRHSTIEEFLFSMRSVPKLYREDEGQKLVSICAICTLDKGQAYS